MTDFDPKAVWPGWETVKILGRGSFGAVYEIRRDMMGEEERAALKVISIPQSSGDIEQLYMEGYDDESITTTFREFLKNILGEYSLMRKLNGSSNVVNCDDARYIQHDDGIGWDIYIKMELLTPLDRALDREIPDEQVIRIGTDICKALMLCKKFNIVHRDIKPANIFVSDLGDYKLGDFGIAKTVEKTTGGTKTGTYEYMAPEVYRDLPYGSTVDIYSLGMVLYWLLNERRTPFLSLPPKMPTGAEKEQARKRRFEGEAIPAPAHGSAELQRIVLKACAYDPKERYQSAEEMLKDLEHLQFDMQNGEAAPESESRNEENNSEFGMRNSELKKDRPGPAVGADALGGPATRAEVSEETVGAGALVGPAKGNDPSDARLTGDRRTPPPLSGEDKPAGVPDGPHLSADVSEEGATVSAVHAAATAAPDEEATTGVFTRKPEGPPPARVPRQSPQRPVGGPGPRANAEAPTAEKTVPPVPSGAPAGRGPAEAKPAAEAKPGKKKLLPILIGIAVLALAAVLVIVLLPKHSTPSVSSSVPVSTPRPAVSTPAPTKAPAAPAQAPAEEAAAEPAEEVAADPAEEPLSYEQQQALSLIDEIEAYREQNKTYSLDELIALTNSLSPDVWSYKEIQVEGAVIRKYRGDGYTSLRATYYDASGQIVYGDAYVFTDDRSQNTEGPSYSRWVVARLHDSFTVITSSRGTEYHWLSPEDSAYDYYYRVEYVDGYATESILPREFYS